MWDPNTLFAGFAPIEKRRMLVGDSDAVVPSPPHNGPESQAGRRGSYDRDRLEAISEMPEQDADTSEVHEAEEVLGMALVACDESPVVLKPREEPFDPPATPHPTKRAAILSLRAPAIAAVPSDRRDIVKCCGSSSEVTVGRSRTCAFCFIGILGGCSQRALIEAGGR